MAMNVHPGFKDYLGNLGHTSKTVRTNRLWARWMGECAPHNLTLEAMGDDASISAFVKRFAPIYNAAHPDCHPFNKDHGSDLKYIIGHYRKFLLSIQNAVAKKQDELENVGEFDIKTIEDGKEKILRSIALRRGQRKFRAELLQAYQSTCAISRTTIPDILEAAHIIPYAGMSTNHICNGLLLRSDIHALFDLSLISINPQTSRVYCSRQIRCEPIYSDFHDRKMRLPKNKNHHPSPKALQRHFDSKIL